MNKRNIIIGIVAVGVIGGIFYLGTLFGVVPQTIVNNLGSVASPYHMGDTVCIGDLCTRVASGEFANATTTVVSIPMTDVAPATSSVSLTILTQTGVATSSFNFACGSSWVAGGANPSGIVHFTTATIASSTSFGTLVNGTATSTSVFTAPPSLLIGPKQYYTCVVRSSNNELAQNATVPNGSFADGFGTNSNTNNTFSGGYSVEFKWNRR